MSKKLKCLSILMAATVATGLISSNSAFADSTEAQETAETTVVSFDDTYEVINKEDSYEVLDKDESEVINDDSYKVVDKKEDNVTKDDSYEIINNEQVDMNKEKNPTSEKVDDQYTVVDEKQEIGEEERPGSEVNSDDIDLTGEIVWEAEEDSIDDNGDVAINNFKFQLRGDNASMVKSDSQCDVEDLVLPSKVKVGNRYYTVTRIMSTGLKNCKELKNVVLPKDLEYIDVKALGESINLETLSIDPSNKYYTCEDNILFNKNKTTLVLYLNKNNTSYTVPEGVTSIGSYAFSTPYDKCPLEDIKLPESLKEIGADSFSYCKITNIVIPANVEDMGLGVFSNCSNLKNVYFAENSKLKTIPLVTFYGCRNLVSVSFPKNLEVIDHSAFKECYKLKNMVLPENLTTLSPDAFMNCENLTNVVIPESVTRVGERAFGYCSNLTNVIFNCDDLSKIESQTFYACYKLKNVKLPENLKTIESEAFAACNELKDFKIPASTTDIADDAFNNN